MIDCTICTLDVLQACDACADMGMTYTIIVQCTDCVVFPSNISIVLIPSSIWQLPQIEVTEDQSGMITSISYESVYNTRLAV